MKILALECSAKAASAAVLEDGEVKATAFSSIAVTHSETLIPLAVAALQASKTTAENIDYFAVSSGPGSFTGVRIGISAIKGLAVADGKKCIGVSTLLAMSYPFRSGDGIVCCVMDARCKQVYNALFEIKNGEITRLTEDRALLLEELASELENYADKKITVTGDGTAVFMPFVEGRANIRAADPLYRYQSAVGVALAAEKEIDNAVSPEQLLPIYLRLPQAERELKAKQNTGGLKK